MSKPRNTAAYACSLLLISLLPSCSSGSSGSPGTFHPAGTAAPAATASAPTTAATPPYTAAQIDANVIDRYRAFQAAFTKAYASGDPTPLTDVATDPLLTIITNDVNAQAKKGILWRFTNFLSPKISNKTKTGSAVVVIDCVRTIGASKFSAKTGKRLATSQGTTYVYQARFLWDGTTWKITEARKGKRC